MRATRAAQETKTQSIADPGALDHATLVVKTQRLRAKKWLRFSQAFVALHFRSMEKVSTSSQEMSHTVRGWTVLERLWMKYTRQRYLAASTWQNRKGCKTQNRSALNGGWAISTCILSGGTCKWAGMEETC